MQLKLALRNIKSKPFSSFAIALAVAVVVALIFCMFSFDGAVTEFVYATETAVSGQSDIVIKYNSAGNKITSAKPLENIDGIEYISPMFSVYAQSDDEYVSVKGMDQDKFSLLNSINIISGSMSDLEGNTNRIAVSEKTAKVFGLQLGSKLTLSLADRTGDFFVAVIAKSDGYFISDSPYTIVGHTKGFVSALIGSPVNIYNEIYIKASGDIDTLMQKIRSIPEYQSMTVERSIDHGQIATKSTGLSAPIVVASGAVIFLAIAGIYVLHNMSVKNKKKYLAKLSNIGASKKQILSIFVIESSILSIVGGGVGLALANLVFFALLKIALSSTVAFSVSALWLALAFVIGVVVSILFSVLLLIDAFLSKPRQALTKRKNIKVQAIIALCTILVTTALILVENFVVGAKGVLSLVNVILIVLSIFVASGFVLRLVARLFANSKNGNIKVLGQRVKSDIKLMKMTSLLSAGMAVGMLLFMSWNITTSVFDSYLDQIDNLVFVSNVQESIDETAFLSDKVSVSAKTVWSSAKADFGDKSETVNLMGSSQIFDILDFGFQTNQNELMSKFAKGKSDNGMPYAFFDIAKGELHNIKVGDTVVLDMNNRQQKFEVGGFLQQTIFAGQYVVMSDHTAREFLGASIDSVILKTTADKTDDVVAEVQSKFSDKNYYAVSARNVYYWSNQSTLRSFALVGAVAFIVAILICFVLVQNAVVGQDANKEQSRAYFLAGMSKSKMLSFETAEYALVSGVSVTLSLLVVPLLVLSMIGGLRFFNLYFDFMFNFAVVILVGLAFAIFNTLLPVVLRLKK